MRKALTAFLVASVAVITSAIIPLTASTSTTSCDDVKFVFVRGSGQTLNDKEYSAFKQAMKAELSRAGSNLYYSFYELGSQTHGGARYPAVEISPTTAIGAKVSAGSAFSYGSSVNQGITELKAYIKDVSKACPSTKFVLAGYSQGAQIITMAAEDINSNKIVYAATFGDPKLYLPEGKGLFPDACRGKNLSPYREYAPNCRTSAGSLGAKDPYQTSSWKNKKGLWCNDKDIICGAGLSLTNTSRDSSSTGLLANIMAGHTSYVADGIISSAAKTIAEKLRAVYPTKIGRVNSTAANRDTIILIDRTYSMNSLIKNYKTEALSLASKTLNAGGRVALYTYGDLYERESTTRLASFGDDLDKISSGLDSIYVEGGGDVPESMLSAIMTAMREQTWRIGATKSIVVLTDAGFHNPDQDGTTIANVISLSYEIDPVSVYVINEDSTLTSHLNQVTSPTGGQVFTSTDSLSTELLTSRPNVTLPLSEYVGAPGQEFTFVATASDNVVSYSWDLDFDGTFEATTTTPEITHIYANTGTGYITVKATDVDGNSSITSAKITVTTADSIPGITNLELASQTSSNATDSAAQTPSRIISAATLTYSFTNGAVAALVYINDAPLGITTSTSLEITDLDTLITSDSTAEDSTTGDSHTRNGSAEDIVVTFTPISASGQLGEPVSLTISQSEINKGYGSAEASSAENSSTAAGETTSTTSSTSSTSVHPTRILAPNSGKK